LPETALHRLARDLRRRGYRPRAARGSMIVLSRAVSPGSPEPEPEPRMDRSPALERFPAVGVELIAVEPAGNGRLRLAWRLVRATEADLGVLPVGADGGVAGEVGPLGGVARPT